MRRFVLTLAVSLVIGQLPSAAGAGEQTLFFQCQDIVFFGPCTRPAEPAPPARQAPPGSKAADAKPVSQPKPAAPAAAAAKPETTESLWAEPTVGPDGQTRVYLPPKAVRDFLDQPTPENAVAYLRWNRDRMQRVDQAVSTLQQAAEQEGLPVPKSPPSRPDALAAGMLPTPSGGVGGAPPRGSALAPPAAQVPMPPASGAPARGINVVYAFAAWCPYSRQQTPIINELAAYVPVRGIVFDSKPDDVQALRGALSFPVSSGNPDFRNQLGVKSYPTMLFLDGSRVVHVERGLQTPDRLLMLLSSLAVREGRTPTGPGVGALDHPVSAPIAAAAPSRDACQTRN
jgi:hypothetical protein